MITDNKHVDGSREIISPGKLKDIFPSIDVGKHITDSRMIISNIISGKDERLLVISGPCSIHNPKEGVEYAKKLVKLKKNYPNLFIVMRTYFEKPRTITGWKGLINDPNLDGSFDIEKGLIEARKFLLEINKLKIPTSTEFLDPIITQYIADLISWGAIGARTTESQTHRQMASGLSMPIGFKNSTSGDVNIALDAIKSSKNPHSFLGVDNNGQTRIIDTLGNNDGHVILRGSNGIPNYNKGYIDKISSELGKKDINSGIVVDLSHDNSGKIHTNQINVAQDISEQIMYGNKKIIGIMIESNIEESKQSFDPTTDDKDNLEYGVSITDACLNLEEQTKEIFNMLNDAIGERKK